jgi:hypothetical protein
MSVGYATCDRCGQTFTTTAGPGRPRKRCFTCAPAYGAAHQKLRAETKASAYGTPCARCGRPMQPGQAIDLDHTDDRTGYLGWSHRACNRRAGAVNGNKARAAAYRAVKNGLNGSRPVPARIPTPEPPDHCADCGRASCGKSYGANSRCW